MKKKIYLFLGLFFCFLTIILIYKNKDNKLNGKLVKEERLSIMIKEDGASEYTKSSSKEIPKGNYTLNEEKTHCENNGKVINYDSILGSVSFSFIGSDRCYLYFDYISKKGWETILLNNGGESAIKAKGNPDFSQVATTNEGMYAMEDDLGTSYYFRGAVDNNWVKFGKDSSGNDMYWRIIRINGDGSIRMIYSGIIAPTESTKVVMNGEGTQIGESEFNSNWNSPEYVGYMYTAGEQYGTSTDSTIKTTLDNWYKTTTLETNISTKALMGDQIFCNDRDIDAVFVKKIAFNYAPFTRLYDNSSISVPSLKCTNTSDRFTVNSSNGNGTLIYPVGLITADEVNLAGGIKNNDNSNYYLYTNITYWLFSPSDWNSIEASQFNVDVDGNLMYAITSSSYGVRPVVSLSSKAKLSGDGTWNNVYTVS